MYFTIINVVSVCASVNKLIYKELAVASCTRLILPLLLHMLYYHLPKNMHAHFLIVCLFISIKD